MVAERKTREQMNIRATAHQRDLIERAAEISGLTRTDFILSAAVRDAEQVILDKTFFTLNPVAFSELIRALDKPPEPNEELVRLMNEPAPWE